MPKKSVRSTVATSKLTATTAKVAAAPTAAATKTTTVTTRPTTTAATPTDVKVTAATQTSPVGTAVGKNTDVTAVPQQPPPYLARFTRRVIRPRDLLVLEFTFVNLRVQAAAGGARELVKSVANKPAYIVVTFPSQHLLEQAFFEDAPEAPLQDPPPGAPPQAADPDKTSPPPFDAPTATSIPVQSRLSGPSRLVFRVPANFTSVPYTLRDVLEACRNYELSVAPTATPPDPQLVFRPGIEVSIVKDAFASPTLLAKALQPITRAKAKTRSPSRRAPVLSRAATRAAASQALAAAVFAESRDQWYAKRSPLARDAAIQAEIAVVDNVLEQIKVLPQLAEPGENETAIEAPTRLIISPNSFGAWVHALDPVESAQTSRVELWHTRLAVRGTGGVTEADDFRRAVRAIWSPDANISEPFTIPSHLVPPSPFRASLDRFDRHNIVHLSANHRLYIPNTQPQRRHKPVPIDVDRLMLTTLGAWINMRGAWDPPAPLSVEEWRHRATLGRDHYVRVVYAGALYPFGHRASLVKVTERKFHPELKGNAAVLRQRMFIVVREPYRLLGDTGYTVGGESLNLKMPLKSARLTTLVTPNLESPELKKCAVVDAPGNANPEAQSIFWPHVGGPVFRFHLQFERGASASSG